ncbi:MAG: DUF2800 domain-containing protein [Chthoniobacteraceae bacterium]
MSLRPSNLPKLAECPCYDSNPNAGPAAARGSALDALFRARMQGDLHQAEMFYQANGEDIAAVEWAVTSLKVLAGDSPVVTREEDCRVTIPGFEKPGTADALVLQKFAHADLKTGAMRNYREQMAAYALGLMDAHFASEWTAYLLFCDQRELVTIHFTYAEAKTVVEGVVSAYNDATKKPALCEYCGWCSKEETCEARLALAQDAVAVVAPGFSFEAVLADNEKLSKFLLACSVLEDFQERAEETAKERLQAGATVPGWKLITRRGLEFVDHVTVGHHIQALGFGAILAAYGNLSAKKFRELWQQKLPQTSFPEEAVKHGKASLSLRQTHKN